MTSTSDKIIQVRSSFFVLCHQLLNSSTWSLALAGPIDSLHRFSIHKHMRPPLEHLGARTLLGAPGLTTRSKKLLGAKGIATRSKKQLHRNVHKAFTSPSGPRAFLPLSQAAQSSGASGARRRTGGRRWSVRPPRPGEWYLMHRYKVATHHLRERF